MAEDGKKTVNSAEETESKNEAAAKVAKAAKSSPAKAKKQGPSASTRIKKFFKDVKGETKKIVWPDAKTVFKSTGVVLLVVVICALIIYGIDQGLSAGVQGLKGLADKEETTISEDADKDAEETKADDKADSKDEDKEETKKADKKDADKEETKSDDKETTKAAKGEETTAEKTTEASAEE